MDDADARSQADREWLIRDELLWRKAHEVAAKNPGIDVSGVYHVLRNLQKTPSKRLKDALDHGRIFRIHSR